MLRKWKEHKRKSIALRMRDVQAQRPKNFACSRRCAMRAGSLTSIPRSRGGGEDAAAEPWPKKSFNSGRLPQ